MSDIIGGLGAIGATTGMLMLLWHFGLEGLWNAIHRVTYRGWSRLAHGRPPRPRPDYALIVQMEREKFQWELDHPEYRL